MDGLKDSMEQVKGIHCHPAIARCKSLSRVGCFLCEDCPDIIAWWGVSKYLFGICTSHNQPAWWGVHRIPVKSHCACKSCHSAEGWMDALKYNVSFFLGPLDEDLSPWRGNYVDWLLMLLQCGVCLPKSLDGQPAYSSIWAFIFLRNCHW